MTRTDIYCFTQVGNPFIWGCIGNFIKRGLKLSVDSSVDAISADLSENVAAQNATLHRKIGWQGAFWVASGVPALVLFSIGAIAATVGKPAWMIWAISIAFGFIQ